jgi:hypothetical protein
MIAVVIDVGLDNHEIRDVHKAELFGRKSKKISVREQLQRSSLIGYSPSRS